VLVFLANRLLELMERELAIEETFPLLSAERNQLRRENVTFYSKSMLRDINIRI